MHSTNMRMMASSRYRGDVSLLKEIRKDEKIGEHQKRVATLKNRSQARLRLLANAMRVSEEMLPTVSQSMKHLSGHVDVGKPLEAFVFSDGQINAFVTETTRHFLVGISSGAVTLLSSQELEFVIGHELGHALFGHTDVGAGHLAESGQLTMDQGKLLRSWQRAAEISADRAGLLCCKDIEVASSALLKTLAGLSLQTMRAQHIGDQWESLLEELLDEGSGDLWEHTHPFPPIRIKALAAFWEGHQSGDDKLADDKIGRWLSVMDAPGALTGTGPQDGLLVRFLFWGGLFIGTADGPLTQDVRERLDSLTVPGIDLDKLLSANLDLAAEALSGFRSAKESRRTKLRSSELTGLMKQLVDFAALDDVFTDHERARLKILANEFRISERAVDMMIEQFQKEKVT